MHSLPELVSRSSISAVIDGLGWPANETHEFGSNAQTFVKPAASGGAWNGRAEYSGAGGGAWNG